ncbi:single-strand binding protein [Faunimonas pinastri]|uniref:Single-stranded DNA-binding protein n=1 Tax=Faunimonas pinastri TaxID=1855383 RepID=A0A1H9F6R6_9HYPH|nr:single-stranded DNA-binding protein [Faunimonas pinastri]SEQ33676.1 single-strand binding protein [Faunimonas pinastri]
MQGMNTAMLIGNVGRDPEIRRTASGKPVAGFSLATTKSWKDRESGEKKQATEWHHIVVFSEGLVGVVEQYVRKGTPLFIQGEIRTRKWTDQGNTDRYTTEIVLNGFDAKLNLLGSGGGGRPGLPDNDAGYGGGEASSPPRHDDLDDEIPF